MRAPTGALSRWNPGVLVVCVFFCEVWVSLVQVVGELVGFGIFWAVCGDVVFGVLRDLTVGVSFSNNFNGD